MAEAREKKPCQGKTTGWSKDVEDSLDPVVRIKLLIHKQGRSVGLLRRLYCHFRLKQMIVESNAEPDVIWTKNRKRFNVEFDNLLAQSQEVALQNQEEKKDESHGIR